MGLSYGGFGRAVERLLGVFFVAAAGAMMAMSGPVSAQTANVADVKPIKMAVLGDSLTAGYGLPASAAFPVRLQKALAAKGIATEIHNAGVSGDTMTGGLLLGSNGRSRRAPRPSSSNLAPTMRCAVSIRASRAAR
jgi:acyl-CoA thioesterase-1